MNIYRTIIKYHMTFSSNNVSTLIYLILLLSVLFFLFILSNKKYLNRNLQNLAIWFLIFFGAVACYYFWTDISFNVKNENDKVKSVSDDTVVIGKENDGHFYLTLQLNETPVKFLVDTGATLTLLSKQDFNQLGKNVNVLSSQRRLETANGKILANQIEISSITAHGHQLGPSELLVVSKDFEGPKQSLLGLDLLNKFQNYEISKSFLKIQLK